MTEAVSRAAGKLEAALARFGLAARVAGAHAESTWAPRRAASRRRCCATAPPTSWPSTWVTASSCPSCATTRASRRWRASTGSASRSTRRRGPSTSSPVDVSFVAARNMLRGLARFAACGPAPRASCSSSRSSSWRTSRCCAGGASTTRTCAARRWTGGEEGGLARASPSSRTRTRPWPAAQRHDRDPRPPALRRASRVLAGRRGREPWLGAKAAARAGRAGDPGVVRDHRARARGGGAPEIARAARGP